MNAPNQTEERSATIDVAACLSNRPIRELITSLDPDWSWWEPRPGEGIDDGFKPVDGRKRNDLQPLLRPGKPRIPQDIAIDELRLFWADAALHWITDRGQGSHLYCWHGGKLPEGFDRLAISFGSRTTLLLEHDVLLLDADDRKRFGMFGIEFPTESDFTLRQHLVDGVVVAWTLLCGSRT